MPDYILVVLVLIGSKVLDFLVSKYLKKVDADYVTPEACKACREDCKLQRQQGIDELNRKVEKMSETLGDIKGVFLVLVTKEQITSEDLKVLTR